MDKTEVDKLNSGFADILTVDPRVTAAPISVADKLKSISPEKLYSQAQAMNDAFYEVVDIEDMEFNEVTKTFSHECPCGDVFTLTLDDIEDGEDIAYCPSCTLKIKVRYNPDDFLLDDDE